MSSDSGHQPGHPCGSVDSVASPRFIQLGVSTSVVLASKAECQPVLWIWPHPLEVTSRFPVVPQKLMLWGSAAIILSIHSISFNAEHWNQILQDGVSADNLRQIQHGLIQSKRIHYLFLLAKYTKSRSFNIRQGFFWGGFNYLQS